MVYKMCCSSLLRRVQDGVGNLLFFAFWAALMTLYVIFFLPETKGVPLEEMQVLWARHWFWGNFVRNKVCC